MGSIVPVAKEKNKIINMPIIISTCSLAIWLFFIINSLYLKPAFLCAYLEQVVP